jgi:hydrogenase maturation protease
VTAALLVFGWGNPSRGDDALGPLFVERFEELNLPDVECLTDFQLQVEHALDLAGRKQILFVDASIDVAAPFAVTPIGPLKDASFSTHAMSPQAVLEVYRELTEEEPPPAGLLAIRGERFELGEPLSEAAADHLDAAVAWAANWARDQSAQIRM